MAVLVIVVVIAVVLASQGRSTSGTMEQLAPASVVQAMTGVSPQVVTTVGSGGQPSELNRLASSTPALTQNGKPLIVYVGAEYCPFCAAERWSLVMALSRFGTFTDLHEIMSSSSDLYPDTNTLSFHGSSYVSSTITFSATELQDRNRQPLESPSAQAEQIFSSYDRPPYTGAALGYPFLDIGGRFVLSQTGFSPSVLQGMTWDQIAAALSDANARSTKAIVGQANWLTAAICNATGNQPAAACSAPMIQSLETQLGSRSPVGS